MLIHPMPDPVVVKLGPVAIHWYGLMYLTGFLLGLYFGKIRIRQPHLRQAGWTDRNLDDLLFYIVLGIVLGGRLGEVLFYHPAYYFSRPLEIFAIWRGGMSYHGGFLGVIFAMYWWSKKNNRHLVDTWDLIAPLIQPGYIAGRIGNFINAELPGRVADPSLPWAMIWPNVDALPRHPSPLYQALVDGALMFVILWFFARKERPRGAVSAMYCLLYGSCRTITEYFRIPDYDVTLAGIHLSAGQMLSLPMALVGLIWLWLAYRKPAPPPTAYQREK
ncbi:MAG: prolipoprotein diacylglyceryl transferase [Burkholderiaceae bacterium]|jgi:phosphatidylglycerol:prolipoprotein diacylglycerol transferase|nr:prolipoprotein diacylglyceryl transferase [Burkholderiaceae bacterium]